MKIEQRALFEWKDINEQEPPLDTKICLLAEWPKEGKKGVAFAKRKKDENGNLYFKTYLKDQHEYVFTHWDIFPEEKVEALTKPSYEVRPFNPERPVYIVRPKDYDFITAIMDEE